jgi:VIT1/CCC1 family predicted Fe2+/Mn2+ transporter
MDKRLLAAALKMQEGELSEYEIYTQLAERCKDSHNAQVLHDIAEAEKAHAGFWEKMTGRKVRAKRFKVWSTVLTARALGLTFTLKRMEKGEKRASKSYKKFISALPGAESMLAEEEVWAGRAYKSLIAAIPEAREIMDEEDDHEAQLLNMLDEEMLQYMGSIVLGLNDALVELTGSLAGFSLAMESPSSVSLAGLVTGVSGALSMAASEFLSSRANNEEHAGRSAVYTGAAYLVCVIVLILPFLLLNAKFVSLAITLALAVLIIFAFNYYLSIAKDLNFKQRFGQMAGVSLGVAAVSFLFSWLLKSVMGIDA